MQANEACVLHCICMRSTAPRLPNGENWKVASVAGILFIEITISLKLMSRLLFHLSHVNFAHKNCQNCAERVDRSVGRSSRINCEFSLTILFLWVSQANAMCTWHFATSERTLRWIVYSRHFFFLFRALMAIVWDEWIILDKLLIWPMNDDCIALNMNHREEKGNNAQVHQPVNELAAMNLLFRFYSNFMCDLLNAN